MVEIHPDVTKSLLFADTVQDHLLTHIDKIKALTSEGLSEDRDIAVKVDMNGELIDLWLKPGILDKKTAAEIAKEITRLVTSAGQESAAQVSELFRAAHEFPDFDTVVAEYEAAQATKQAAGPELTPPRR